jgi:hypothetical protein
MARESTVCDVDEALEFYGRLGDLEEALEAEREVREAGLAASDTSGV